jgi:splicing factor 3A subunit 3
MLHPNTEIKSALLIELFFWFMSLYVLLPCMCACMRCASLPVNQLRCLTHVCDGMQDEYVYNPLKLPLGPDGKPIPYWLYKLHGLNQEYKCDICGGDIFRGRREYERHFRESKHIQAMAALGITSSKAFFEVTKVEEAIALWKNLQNRSAGNWNPDMQEEFEDAEGNVYNRRTYLDLQRQGLV